MHETNTVTFLKWFQAHFFHIRPVAPGGAGGAPDFGRSVTLISAKGGRLCPPNNTGPPGFSDLSMALGYTLRSVSDIFYEIVSLNANMCTYYTFLQLHN